MFNSAVAQPDAAVDSAELPATAAVPAESNTPPPAAESAPVTEPSAILPADPAPNSVVPAADAGSLAATEPATGEEAPVDSNAPDAKAAATGAIVLPPTEPAPPAKPRYNRDDVRWIQQRLQELGYYNGAIDGAYGRVTREAIKSYQVDQELEQDGRPTSELREFMWRNGG